MIRLSAPFLLSDTSQIPGDLVETHHLLLEGTVTDANSFNDEDFWLQIRASIKATNRKYPNQLQTLHFPTDNADYLNSARVNNHLRRFIELADELGVKKIVLHSNCIQPYTEFRTDKLQAIRNDYIKYFHELDGWLSNTRVAVCIENLPVIGDHGVDFDSVFVFPEDFQAFTYKNIKIAWDICHWLVTVQLHQVASNLSTHIHADVVSFNDFYAMKNIISHLHFSSFKGLTLPHSNSLCLEGVIPPEGDVDPKTLVSILNEINSWNTDLAMTLEIRELDYCSRDNLKKTIEWLKQQGLVL